ncbi:MAG TPA: inositol oxygenase family protein [Methylomirabilota bacterium]|nr:inositol oxygenase family protein [Methylomirabilota bacterium]
MNRWDLLRAGALSGIGALAGAVIGPERLHRWSHRLSPGWQEFAREARAVSERHWRQTRETVATLKQKYEQPVLGRQRVWDLVEKLALCVDPTDARLYCTSQLIHVQQIVAGMERDGVNDPDMLIAAITHDLGKVLLLTGEAPENVVGMNAPIGRYPAGVGLDNVVFQWNHDEFIYSRLKDYLPDHLAWLLRYHSIEIPLTRPFMDASDRAYLERYLLPFRKYDQGTKSACVLPPRTILEKHRDLIEGAFPRSILV